MRSEMQRLIRTLSINGAAIPCYYYHTLVLGSGSASLCAAVRLKRLGVDDMCILTDDVRGGTSRNTGSDKQTYYKLSDSTSIPDSPYLMAEALMSGGAMHGDIALVEAKSSESAFYHLVGLGVPFPHDEWGGYTGYKTDHDPRNRGTSLGPHTSKVMVEYLEKECLALGIDILDKHECIRLITYDDRIAGAVVFHREGVLNPEGAYSVFFCDNMVFGLGGPAGLYKSSVYPARHTGGIGLAFEIGAEAVNLTESQFGIASTEFRWNLSGSYQQVIPYYYSRDPETGECFSFLNDHFPSMEKLAHAVFLKGYQWPFDPSRIRNLGSSLIDLLVYREAVEKKREVYMDFRENLRGDDRTGYFSADLLPDEVLRYWQKSGISAGTPIGRLQQMNPAAAALYKKHNIDLFKQPLKIAVCAQHNNGGLAGDIWWESTNIRHLFPVGEINGTHGVTRPGGSALNSGQVGALRAAKKIANVYRDSTLAVDKAVDAAECVLPEILDLVDSVLHNGPGAASLKNYQNEYRKRMTESGGMLRSEKKIDRACADAALQHSELGRLGISRDRLSLFFRMRHMVLAHRIYLEAIKNYLEQGGGSRGSYLVFSGRSSDTVADLLNPDNIKPEVPGLRNLIQTVSWDNNSEKLSINWKERRPVPRDEGWFENVWSRFIEKSIYGIKEVSR